MENAIKRTAAKQEQHFSCMQAANSASEATREL